MHTLQNTAAELLTYFHNSSKKEHITKYSIKSKINSTEAKIKLSFQNTAPELQPSQSR